MFTLVFLGLVLLAQAIIIFQLFYLGGSLCLVRKDTDTVRGFVDKINTIEVISQRQFEEDKLAERMN